MFIGLCLLVPVFSSFDADDDLAFLGVENAIRASFVGGPFGPEDMIPEECANVQDLGESSDALKRVFDIDPHLRGKDMTRTPKPSVFVGLRAAAELPFATQSRPPRESPTSMACYTLGQFPFPVDTSNCSVWPGQPPSSLGGELTLIFGTGYHDRLRLDGLPNLLSTKLMASGRVNIGGPSELAKPFGNTTHLILDITGFDGDLGRITEERDLAVSLITFAPRWSQSKAEFNVSVPERSIFGSDSAYRAIFGPNGSNAGEVVIIFDKSIHVQFATDAIVVTFGDHPELEGITLTEPSVSFRVAHDQEKVIVEGRADRKLTLILPAEGKTTDVDITNVTSGSGYVRVYAMAKAVKVALPRGISDPVPLIAAGEGEATLVLVGNTQDPLTIIGTEAVDARLTVNGVRNLVMSWVLFSGSEPSFVLGSVGKTATDRIIVGEGVSATFESQVEGVKDVSIGRTGKLIFYSSVSLQVTSVFRLGGVRDELGWSLYFRGGVPATLPSIHVTLDLPPGDDPNAKILLIGGKKAGWGTGPEVDEMIDEWVSRTSLDNTFPAVYKVAPKTDASDPDWGIIAMITSQAQSPVRDSDNASLDKELSFSAVLFAVATGAVAFCYVRKKGGQISSSSSDSLSFSNNGSSEENLI
jgi:hypothetical protein